MNTKLPPIRFLPPQFHRYADMLVFPSLLALSLWMSRRNQTAASLIALNAAIEGGAFLVTDYPPAIVPKISFRDHLRLATATGLAGWAVTLLLRNIGPEDRAILLAMYSGPIVLSAASRPE
ncbi:MAG TPA: hypothetical protein VF585_07720 [Chthoniobacterales bacterium]|jgi:hypothetical protein